MDLKTQVKRLEIRARQMSGRKLCSHMPPIIRWPNGTVENGETHKCAKPRLVISLCYSDGTAPRTQQAAIDHFEEELLRGKIPPDMLLELIVENYPLTPETHAALLEKVKEHEARAFSNNEEVAT
ncbi:MAG TPA: hypothetical protein DHU55_02790 [Blastocatellia bacterium]|nr:hypothetical protein [Blastocatellia bacterium]HAF21557.1 hypothetical protein [Blastocatellia bacterium]HCX28689.1 hypothetical protein [Blastocatellia bacterium]